jgi:uncharacterized protein (DUF3820 family)
MISKEVTLPFGPHEGKKLDEIPESYLKWVTQQNWSPGDVWGNAKMRELVPLIRRHLATRIDPDAEMEHE